MIQVHEDYLQFRGIYIITLVVVDVYYVDVYYVDIYYVDVYYVDVYYVDVYYVAVYYVDVYYGLDLINQFNTTTFLCLSQPGPGFLTTYVYCALCCVQ